MIAMVVSSPPIRAGSSSQDGSWSPFGTEITLGGEVRNIFDQDPPYVNIAPSGNGSGGYDATAASPLGRVFAASLRVKF